MRLRLILGFNSLAAQNESGTENGQNAMKQLQDQNPYTVSSTRV